MLQVFLLYFYFIQYTKSVKDIYCVYEHRTKTAKRRNLKTQDSMHKF